MPQELTAQVRALSHGLRANATDPSLVEEATVNGVDVLRFPVRALKEMVLQCMTCGPGGEFVAASTIKASVDKWRGVPVTIDHPKDNAGAPRYAQEADAVGVITSSSWRDGWLNFVVEVNRDRLASHSEGAGILNALLTGVQDVEISTGYETALVLSEGSHDGRQYYIEQRDLGPDHLALLPMGTPGACSVADGCGAARLNRDGGDAMKQPVQMERATLMGLLRLVLNLQGEDAQEAPEGTPPPDGEEEQGELAAASGSEGEPPAADDNDEPGEEIGGAPQSEESTMNRDKVIQALAANSAVPFEETDLTEMTDERLKSLADLAGVDCGCGKPAANSGGAGDEAEQVAANEGQEEEVQAEAAAAPAGIDLDGLKQELIGAIKEDLAPVLALADNARREHDEEKTALVTALVQNESCRVSEDGLKAMDLPTLRDLALSFAPQDFSGLAAPRNLSGGRELGYTPAPLVLTADN